MQKTKIEWCDMTWNPVTGCRNTCPYCYARRIYKRFKMNFAPAFHGSRLNEPTKIKTPQNIFVCSMGDLFGPWVPTRWILDVFDACSAAPQHNYLFLTKYYRRYEELDDMALLPYRNNFWYGTTAVTIDDRFFNSSDVNTFLSIEPIQMRLGNVLDEKVNLKWIIVGAETGNRKDKIKPKKEWIVDLVMACSGAKIPLFMKNSLEEVCGDKLIQELPKGLMREEENDVHVLRN